MRKSIVIGLMVVGGLFVNMTLWLVMQPHNELVGVVSDKGLLGKSSYPVPEIKIEDLYPGDLIPDGLVVRLDGSVSSLYEICPESAINVLIFGHWT